MTIRVRRYISALLDAYIPGGAVFAIMLVIGRFSDLDLNLVAGIVWSIILMKDIFAGQSFFKKLLGLKIVYKVTQEPIRPLTSIIRNFVALPLFPIEVLAFILFGRRFSDWLLKTEVVATEQVKIRSILHELRRYKSVDYIKGYVVSFILSVLGFNIYLWVWMYWLPEALIYVEGK